VEWRNWKEPGSPVEYELYDYDADPLESRNLAAEQPAELARLRATLERYPPPVP
jgi:iduronate 2-sulfatase